MPILNFSCQPLNRGAPLLAVGSDLVIDSSLLTILITGLCHQMAKPRKTFGVILLAEFQNCSQKVKASVRALAFWIPILNFVSVRGLKFWEHSHPQRQGTFT